MLERPRRESASEDEESLTVDVRPDGISRSTAFRVGRLLYGGILAFMAIDGLRNAEQRAEYADAKGVPAPETANDAAHSLLLLGGVGISLWRLPTLAASAAAAFFLGVTPMMHDFWALDDPEEKQQQTIHFMKNGALLGAALAMLGVARNDD